MAKKTASEPVVTVDLHGPMRGKRGIDIAEMIENGEVTQAEADAFVAARAVYKLHKAQEA